jgi:hypothetical protein
MVIEGALEDELDDHLGYAKHDAAGRNGGNSRNGSRPKTVLTDTGPVQISVPPDRDSSFEAKIAGSRPLLTTRRGWPASRRLLGPQQKLRHVWIAHPKRASQGSQGRRSRTGDATSLDITDCPRAEACASGQFFLSNTSSPSGLKQFCSYPCNCLAHYCGDFHLEGGF